MRKVTILNALRIPVKCEIVNDTAAPSCAAVYLYLDMCISGGFVSSSVDVANDGHVSQHMCC